MEPLWKIRESLVQRAAQVFGRDRDDGTAASTSGGAKAAKGKNVDLEKGLWDVAIPFTNIRPVSDKRLRGSQSKEAIRERLESMAEAVPPLSEQASNFLKFLRHLRKNCLFTHCFLFVIFILM